MRFFFSIRRRHTRCLSDWSSDVCSSDLTKLLGRLLASGFIINDVEAGEALDFYLSVHRFVGVGGVGHVDAPTALEGGPNRSEERRVGKECRAWRRWCETHKTGIT